VPTLRKVVIDQTRADAKALCGQRHHLRVYGLVATMVEYVVKEGPTNKLAPTLKAAFKEHRKFIVWVPFETESYHGWEMVVPIRTIYGHQRRILISVINTRIS
jgi:hypothetical protein